MPSSKAKVMIGVGGRFHAEAMANALSTQFQVHLVSSFPKSRIHVDSSVSLTSRPFGEGAYRLLSKARMARQGEQLKMLLFGKQLAHVARHSMSDRQIIWSSFAYETFQEAQGAERVLVRDSTHIENQIQVLSEEYQKLSIQFKPDPLCIRRECAEYQLSDRIWVLSEYAKQSFLERGFGAERLRVLPLGVNTQLFFPKSDRTVKLPLKVVYFGAISVRKGVYYLLKAFQKIPKSLAHLTLIGGVEPAFTRILNQFNHYERYPSLPHKELSARLREYDVFVFPTLEDGFGATVIQAMASGLLPVTTACHGTAHLLHPMFPDLTLEPYSAESIEKAITWIAQNREVAQNIKDRVVNLSKEYGMHQYSQKVCSLALECPTGRKK